MKLRKFVHLDLRVDLLKDSPRYHDNLYSPVLCANNYTIPCTGHAILFESFCSRAEMLSNEIFREEICDGFTELRRIKLLRTSFMCKQLFLQILRLVLRVQDVKYYLLEHIGLH